MQNTVSGGDAKGEVLIADETNAEQRIDSFIASKMPPHVSRSRIQAIMRAGGVSVDGFQCTEPKTKLKGGETIQLDVPEAVDATPQPEAISLDIAFEDDHLIVINKSAGLVVHPGPGNWEGTLVNALLYHCGESLSGIGGVKRPGIVHRLDKDTSGLMVIAKTDVAHAGLSSQFADHGRTGPLERVYLALAWDYFERMAGTINAPLGRAPNNRLKRAVVREGTIDAREAITHFTVLKQAIKTESGGASATLVECRLETGRTHQIRVHLSHIGHPLVGDAAYGKHFQTKANTLSEKLQALIKSFNRQALHAKTLGFEHPVTREHLRFEANPPKDLQDLIDAFALKLRQ